MQLHHAERGVTLSAMFEDALRCLRLHTVRGKKVLYARNCGLKPTAAR